MDYINYILIGFLFILVVVRFLPTKGIRTITTSDLKKELSDKNKQFIDVRTTGEFNTKKISGFKNIPLQTLNNSTTKSLAKDKETIVICQSGMRSQKASKILKKLGFTKVTNVKGGMSSWR